MLIKETTVERHVIQAGLTYFQVADKSKRTLCNYHRIAFQFAQLAVCFRKLREWFNHVRMAVCGCAVDAVINSGFWFVELFCR